MFRILFLGTPDFAVPSLRALANDGRFEIVGVVTQPDKPVGRSATLTAPPIKITAQELGIKEIRQPVKLSDEAFKTWIEEIGPTCDTFVVVAYGKIFRDWFLALPKQGLVNVHASLLPRWRGASPINAAIASGDAESGVTIMKIEAEMDAGPMLAVTQTPISKEDTAETLHDRLADLGAKLLPDTLAEYLEGKIKPKPQDASKATFCKTLTREDGKIDWAKSAEEIERLVRAYHPWPGTWTEIDGKRLKILKAQVVGSRQPALRSLQPALSASEGTNGSPVGTPGQRFVLEESPAIECGSGTAMKLVSVQPEGKREMDGKAFLSGVRGW